MKIFIAFPSTGHSRTGTLSFHQKKSHISSYGQNRLFISLSPRLHQDIKLEHRMQITVILWFSFATQLGVVFAWKIPSRFSFVPLDYLLSGIKKGQMGTDGVISPLSPWMPHWPSFPTVIDTVSASLADFSSSEFLGPINTVETSAVWWISSIQKQREAEVDNLLARQSLGGRTDSEALNATLWCLQPSLVSHFVSADLWRRCGGSGSPAGSWSWRTSTIAEHLCLQIYHRSNLVQHLETEGIRTS